MQNNIAFSVMGLFLRFIVYGIIILVDTEIELASKFKGCHAFLPV